MKMKLLESHVNSIKKYFPESKLILSTWKNSNSNNLNIDQKIGSVDPGANYYYYFNDNETLNNINRMITSSCENFCKN